MAAAAAAVSASSSVASVDTGRGARRAHKIVFRIRHKTRASDTSPAGGEGEKTSEREIKERRWRLYNTLYCNAAAGPSSTTALAPNSYIELQWHVLFITISYSPHRLGCDHRHRRRRILVQFHIIYYVYTL